MDYKTFFSYNVIGGFVWVFGITICGYFLGNIPLIRDNFSKVVLLIIVISVLPIIYSILKEKFSTNKKEA